MDDIDEATRYISDSELQRVLQMMRQEMPNLGEVCMHRCVTSVYYRLFYYLEHHNHLNPDNKFHLYALHYVYLFIPYQPIT